jgi:GAF domain-containing protein
MNLVGTKDHKIDELDPAPGFEKAFTRQELYIAKTAHDSHFQSILSQHMNKGKRIFLKQVKELACVPLMDEGTCIGVLTVRMGEEEFFTEEHNRVALEDFARRAAIAMQHAGQLDRERSRTQRMYRITEPITLQDRLQEIAKNAYDLLGGSGSIIYLLARDRSELILAAIDGIEGENVPKANSTLPLGQGIVGKVIARGEPLLVNRYDTWEDPIEQFKGLFKSVIEVPMKLNDEVIGVIAVVADEEKQKRFDKKQDVPTLEKFAELAALAIHNASLYDNWARVHYSANLISANVHDLGEVTTRILESLQSLIYFDSAAIHLMKNDYLYIVDCLGFPNYSEIKTIYLPLTKDRPNYRVLMEEKPQPIIVPDFGQSEYKELLGDEGNIGLLDTVSWLGMPLVSGEQAIGMISFDRSRPNVPFQYRDIESVRALVTHAAIAIQNAKAHKRQEMYRQVLETIFDADRVITGEYDLDTTLKNLVEQAVAIVQKPITSSDELKGYGSIVLIKGNLAKNVATYPDEYQNELGKEVDSIIDLELNQMRNNGQKSNCSKSNIHPVEDNKVPDDATVDQEDLGKVIRKIIETGKSDVAESAPAESFSHINFRPKPKSRLSVPIKNGQRVTGIISVFSTEEDYFSKEHQRDLEFLAIHAAVSMKISRLLNSRFDLATLTLPTYTLRHNIGNRLPTIRGIITNIKDSEMWCRDTTLYAELEQISEHIDAIPDIDIDLQLSLVANMTDVDVAEVIDDKIRNHEDFRELLNVAGENVKLQLLKGYKLRCDAHWLAHAIENLLDNAYTAMKDKGGIKRFGIAMYDDKDQGGVKIEFTNNGLQISNKIIFDLFEQTVPTEERGRRRERLGAFIVSEIVAVYDGYITVGSTNKENTTIVLWLPAKKEVQNGTL